MTIESIIDEVYPETETVQHSIVEREFWLYKRERLRKMIEQFVSGQVVDFEPLKIAVNIHELLKLRFN